MTIKILSSLNLRGSVVFYLECPVSHYMVFRNSFEYLSTVLGFNYSTLTSFYKGVIILATFLFPVLSSPCLLFSFEKGKIRE